MNAPSAIIELEGYRNKFIDDNLKVNNSIDFSSLTNSSDNLKDKAKSLFLWLNSQIGYNRFKDLAINMKQISYLNKNDYSTVKGVLAEIYLLLTLEEFKRVNKIDNWKIYHSLIVPFKSGKGSTEIDIALVNLTSILIIEVKSYNGNKTLTDKGTLSVSGKSADLFKQNGMHCKALWEYIEPYALTSKGSIKSIFFDFSNGLTKDKRDEKDKILLPYLNEDNLLKFLFEYKKLKTNNWDSTIYKIFEDLSNSKITIEEHIKYVKSIHGEEVE